MVAEYKFGQMDLSSKDTGRKEEHMDEVDLFMLTGTSMKEIGKEEKLMGMVSMSMRMGLSTKGNGSKTNSTEWVRKHRLMGGLLKDILSLV